MTEYHVTGLKYVPVKVAKDDYEAFKAKYDVVENGGTLSGGYSENKLSSYNGLEAEVWTSSSSFQDFWTASLISRGSILKRAANSSTRRSSR